MEQSPTPERPDPLKPADDACHGQLAARATTPPAPAPAPMDGVKAHPDAADKPGDAEADAAPPPPLTPLGWIKQNSFALVAFVISLGLLYYNFGLDGIWRGAQVVLGLGMVIFIHEMGHFLAAKWCNVHVQTFSLGFGPALPGCSYKFGETTYKIGLVPLGGFVQMVGEGAEADEDESYPRSFKNKTVWQRMFIISAGVVMNVLLGFVIFIIVFQFHGLRMPPAVVAQVDAASPAWVEGVPSGSVFTRIGGVNNPNFEDLKVTVVYGGANTAVDMRFKTHDGDDLVKAIVPRKDANDSMPAIGVAPPRQLKLFPAWVRGSRDVPVVRDSPAAHAVALGVGDVVVRASDPDKDGELTDLKNDPARGWFDAAELCRRIRGLGDKGLFLDVRRAGAKEDVRVEAPKGFDWDDAIVGTTDPKTPDQTFNVKPLPPKPDDPSGDARDVFEFEERMMRLAGKPVVIQVRRESADGKTPAETLNVLIPPAYHVGIGARMKMGEVAAVRKGSSADKAGVKAGDVIVGAKVTGPDGTVYLDLDETKIDPVRLPYDLQQAADKAKQAADKVADKPKVRVELTVLRYDTAADPHTRAKTPLALEWDGGWAYDDEVPYSAPSAEPVPELGLAYRIESTVVDVTPGSPADKAGIQANDRIEQIRFKLGEKNSSSWSWSSWSWTSSVQETWDYWHEMKSKRDQHGVEQDVYDQWAHYFYMLQDLDYRVVQVRVSRENKPLDQELTLNLVEEPEGAAAWPLADRGLILLPESRLEKADNLVQAVGMGVNRTWKIISQSYQNLAGFSTGRISTSNLNGPLSIVTQTFEVARDPFDLLFWLGFISVSIAVVNFLPIPLLDGGHMVFLIYELVRRKPPSDGVRAVAAYVGLAMIGLMMILVFYVDIYRWVYGK